MARHGIMFLLLSLLGGVAGNFMASLLSFWLYPELQSDLAMFLHDLYSFGGVVATVFVWLFYVPALIGLLLLSRRFIAAGLGGLPYLVFFALSFLLVLISQIHLFTAAAKGVLEYLLNTLFAGGILNRGSGHVAQSS